MSYPFVQGISYGPRKGPVKAFVIHLAEGGGTVNFLKADATPPARGVSVHYVIEYTGRIVQMLKESDASGSINPRELRNDDGPAPFGATVRKQVMGEWDNDPNSAVISVEIEGFAATGPNLNQNAALYTLVNDVRSRFPDMGLLGHRDFQNYKPCPGSRIPWAALGGHGAPGVGLHIKLDVTLDDGDPYNNLKRAKVKTAGSLRRVADDARTNVAPGLDLGVVQTGWFLEVDPPTAIYALNSGNELHIIAATLCDATPLTAPPVADCTAAVTAATAPLKAQNATLTSQVTSYESRLRKINDLSAI